MRNAVSHSPLALRATQAAFLEGVAGGAEPALFRQPHCDSPESRWGIYAQGYVLRIAEALENDYPAVGRILGRGPFLSLAGRYVRACPPRSFDLGRAGDRLPGFLDTDPLTTDLPFLADLATLEWRLAESFVAEDVEPLRWSDLADLDAATVADLPLGLLPGTHVVRSRWPLQDLRACSERPDPDVSVALEGRPCILVVYRAGLEVKSRSLDAGEASLLEAIDRGSTLSHVLESEGEEAAIVQMVARFRRLVEEGLFRVPTAP